MSLKSFSAQKDEKLKETITKTINETSEQPEVKSSTKSFGVVIPTKNKKKNAKLKKPYTFSLFPEQYEKLAKIADETGYTSKSELLSVIIDSL